MGGDFFKNCFYICLIINDMLPRLQEFCEIYLLSIFNISMKSLVHSKPFFWLEISTGKRTFDDLCQMAQLTTFYHTYLENLKLDLLQITASSSWVLYRNIFRIFVHNGFSPSVLTWKNKWGNKKTGKNWLFL